MEDIINKNLNLIEVEEEDNNDILEAISETKDESSITAES